MNGDLISREVAVELLRDKAQHYTVSMFATSDECHMARVVALEAANEIESLPAVDAVPVVHGRWESVDSSYWRWTSSDAVSVSHTTYRCGRCGWGTVVKTNYCPNCGAMMRGKSDEAE